MIIRQPVRSLLSTMDSLTRGEDLFSSIMDNFFHHHGYSPLQSVPNPDFSPCLDFTERKNQYIITVEVPGMDKKDCSIEIEDETLILKGEKNVEEKQESEEKYVCERCYGSFRREIRLPSDCDIEKVEASYQDGILTISIGKIEEKEEDKRKTVTIN